MDDLSRQSNSYMRLRFHGDGEEYPRELRIPTFWDSILNIWHGCIKTPESHTLITASGKDSAELTNNFNKVLHGFLTCPDTAQEVFEMFKEVKE